MRHMWISWSARLARRCAPVLLSILCAGHSLALGDETAWSWAGLEILGSRRVPRSEIERLIPIPLGEAYHQGDAPFWTEACAQVKVRFDFASVDCGDRPLRVFAGRKAYLIVDIVEKGDEERMRFREAPSGSVAFGSERMLEIAAELSSITLKAAMAGRSYNESGRRGYLEYLDAKGENEDLGPRVEELARLVPSHRDNLLEVLRGERNPEHRQQAANLLNWAGGDLEKLLRRTLTLLDDPDPGVRNNLSRFMIKFVGQVRSRRLHRRLVDAFIAQIERPSHGDRNKGIYNLLEIAKAMPQGPTYLWRGREPIRYLAENSILFNVQGPARELLDLVDKAAAAEPAGS